MKLLPRQPAPRIVEGEGVLHRPHLGPYYYLPITIRFNARDTPLSDESVELPIVRTQPEWFVVIFPG